MAARPQKKSAKTVRRKPPADGTMRLPHEQDESSRHSPQRPARVMRAAHDDVAEGQVDTDVRGVESRKAFDEHAGDADRSRSEREDGDAKKP